ncbi:LuxR C-terminal-related transcriptional regulator [cf. Phormidesmis sp. LEGE 11477]|uniref:LuxR C-terminal-related transcriptional regulator n=1 Tax=cf. Phormidesmis sp. LEGE 11477 TaxID=1828680 RepID=UPI00187E5CB7|nr:LuxR C-terminal-related transcriptional regulator [cf. Phormidesmis sp. LEGE 11477]MBE9062620.1 GAF domain-containing protein [cf. Phormidesmis sp. LEGE 11477]
MPVSDIASRQSLDASRLLFDLKRCGELVNRFTGCLDAEAIATCTTDGLIDLFGCAFARIWLIEADRKALRLVASAGLYTRLDGSFARVPMGAFKVGKIAQHCIPFLSNALSEENWVKDREWAIKNRIQGFAGLPLIAQNQSIGVLAIFSHSVMAPELLEVFQMLSLSVAGALASALNHQEAVRSAQFQTQAQKRLSPIYLSEQIAAILGPQKLSLLGVEHPLDPNISQILIQVVRHLTQHACQYCRLVYEREYVVLEAMLLVEVRDDVIEKNGQSLSPLGKELRLLSKELRALSVEIERWGGRVQVKIDKGRTVAEARWQIPQSSGPLIERPSEPTFENAMPLNNIPPSSHAPFDSSLFSKPTLTESPLSIREQEVIILLAQGLRDREISKQLSISERTVKFHTKNMLGKLGVKTRTQAVFRATKQGWL